MPIADAQETDSLALEQLVDNLFAAVNERRFAELEKIYGEGSALIAASQRPVVGLPEITEFWEMLLEESFKSIDGRIEEIFVDEAHANALGSYSAILQIDGQNVSDQSTEDETADGFFVIFFLKEEIGWLIKWHMWNAVFD